MALFGLFGGSDEVEETEGEEVISDETCERTTINGVDISDMSMEDFLTRESENIEIIGEFVGGNYQEAEEEKSSGWFW